ncbi:MAG TPA: hypothetical protein VKR58_14120, partial [Aquella sp.]|nr:hypothetical protein [Aquella sp.]
PTSLYNSGLAWEETKKFEGGIDLGLFNDRILMNVSYYLNRSSNQLLYYNLPAVTGFTTIPTNFPATVQNSGLEFLVTTINIKSNSFTWNSSINLSIPRNELIAFPNISNTPYENSLSIGHAITSIKVFHLNGVNDSTGVYQFVDAKGGLTYNPVSTIDNTVFINKAPIFYGGLSNTFSYKGFQLDFLFQFTKQVGANYLFTNNYFSPPGSFGNNAGHEVLTRWQNPGDKSPVEQFTQSYTSNAFVANQYAVQSNYAYTDASYIRLKTLSLSYQFSNQWIRQMHLQACKIYIHGQNLFTITNYKGLDPENQSLTAMPPLKVIVFGFQLSL